MPYTMTLHASGSCRPTSQRGPIAAAAVTMTNKYGRRTTQTHQLPPSPPPTPQRAQLSAIILALQQARLKTLQPRPGPGPRPRVDVTIHTDSKYAMGCMTQWCWKWARNGFRTRRGREVVDRDLIERALLLEGEVLRAGTVEWVWVPRGRNGAVGAVVEGVLDGMEFGSEDEDGDEPVRRPEWEGGSW